MLEITDFIRSRKLVHFDRHRFNVVTDSQNLYLTDFGLAMDVKFELSDPKRHFLPANSYCDIGTFVFRSSRR